MSRNTSLSFHPTVGFSDCHYPETILTSSDPDFEVGPDREIKVYRSLRVGEEPRRFRVYFLGPTGRKVLAEVFVTYDPDVANHHGEEEAEKQDVQIHSSFPARHSARRRMKREWVIPPINVAENDRGPYPNPIVQLQSNEKEWKIVYSITGQGADQPPFGRFMIDRHTGWLVLTQPLDREERATYNLLAHALAEGLGPAEEPMEVVINVIDINDNKPIFTQDSYLGRVSEAAPIDRDEPGQDSSDVFYRIHSQEPSTPSELFFINPVTGGIQVAAAGLDREALDEYKLVIEAADNRGEGLMTSCEVTITVEDSNDNGPQFTQTEYTASVPENQMGALVVKMDVTDMDEPHSPAWRSRFRIVQGDQAGLFNVTTGHNHQEGIITTAAELDFESSPLFTLLVVVENEVAFSRPVSTSTATVTVRVEDRNEPPVFSPAKGYKMAGDPADWLILDGSTGQLRVRNVLDRESPFLTDGTYTAVILAVDSYEIATTGTGTLLIKLEDVNDNAPSVDQRHITVCNYQSQPVELSVRDPDGPGFAQPFRSELLGTSQKQWNVHMNHNILLLLLLLFLRRRRPLKKEVLLLEEELVRDNVYFYDEEGGGEEDQDFDPNLLLFDIGSKPPLRTVVPPLSSAPVYRPRPIDQEDIGEFIDDNLRAADGDPTAPPYDSLLVFEYEGADSKVSSLSSLNSSSSEEEQDYQMLAHWGPAFSRLADLYIRGEEDDEPT
ncbi:LOW QUALITY PROTEIN: B-cadherin-like [Aplochiton taeniatus]